MNHQPTERRILLCATGMSPQVVTETLYALAVNPRSGKAPWIPTEVHIITTSHGAEQARLNLLSEHPGWFNKLVNDYSLPAITFNKDTIHCIQSRDGRDLDDIRSPADNEAAANSIAELVRSLTQDEHSTLHVSLAGGRKPWAITPDTLYLYMDGRRIGFHISWSTASTRIILRFTIPHLPMRLFTPVAINLRRSIARMPPLIWPKFPSCDCVMACQIACWKANLTLWKP